MFKMTNLDTPKKAADYLFENEYKNIIYNEEIWSVSYINKTGNQTWENKVANENKWVRAEMQSCCIKNSKEYPDANFCDQCGIGINKMVSWIKGGYDLDVEHLSEKIEKSLEGKV